MRFMMLMFPAKYYEPGQELPDTKVFEDMNRYNEELAKAGVLLALDGLHHPKTAVRVKLDGGKKKVVDGPFTEAKEIVGGYWIIQTRTRDEAVEWASRVPVTPGDVVELRQIFEMSDFPEDIQKLDRGLADKMKK